MKWRKLEKIGAKYKLVRYFSPQLKILVSFVRYYIIVITAKKRRDEKPILIFAMPKSGSSFIESCLEDYLKQPAIVPWRATLYEQKNGQSIGYELGKRDLYWLKRKNIFYKLHSAGHTSNFDFSTNVAVVKVTRSISEVRDSHIRYVRNTYHHPQFKNYSKLNYNECVNFFNDNELSFYESFLSSWSIDSLEIDHSQLSKKPLDVLSTILKHGRYEIDEERLKKVISEVNSDSSKTLKNFKFSIS